MSEQEQEQGRIGGSGGGPLSITRRTRLTDDEVAALVKAFTTRELADDDWSSYDVVDGAGLVRAVEDMYLPPEGASDAAHPHPSRC